MRATVVSMIRAIRAALLIFSSSHSSRMICVAGFPLLCLGVSPLEFWSSAENGSGDECNACAIFPQYLADGAGEGSLYVVKL